MDGPRGYHAKKSDRSWTEKDKYQWHYLYVESKKIIQMNLFVKQTHRLQKQTYGYQTGKVLGRDELGVWELTYIHYYI